MDLHDLMVFDGKGEATRFKSACQQHSQTLAYSDASETADHGCT